MDSNQMILAIPLKTNLRVKKFDAQSIVRYLDFCWINFSALKLIGAETDRTVMRPNGGNIQNVWKITNTRDVKKSSIIVRAKLVIAVRNVIFWNDCFVLCVRVYEAYECHKKPISYSATNIQKLLNYQKYRTRRWRKFQEEENYRRD